MRPENPAWTVNADVPAANSADGWPERACAGDKCGYEVIAENLPADYPVSAAELAVIETYLGSILDALFKAASEEGEGAGIQATDRSSGSCQAHQPKAPGLKDGKTSRRGRVRARQ